ncbi:hypothetical protein V3C99_007650 [Haemonchus contortus]
MATLQSQQLNLTEEYCIELGVLSATSTYYRVSLLFALTISTISAAAMIYFLARYYGSSLLFHSNLKMLYFFLSLSCLTFDVFNIIAKVLINCCSMYIMYYGETFDIPQWNARLMPSTTYPRSSAVLLTFLIMNFISLLVTITLYAFSRKQRRTLTLSSKFQSNENIIALNLLFMITSVQFFTAFFAQMCGLYLRTYQFKNPLRFAYRENFDLFNYYTLLLPILSTFYFVKVKRRRIKDITNKINMKATGSDGWTNYSNMIQNQWK